MPNLGSMSLNLEPSLNFFFFFENGTKLESGSIFVAEPKFGSFFFFLFGRLAITLKFELELGYFLKIKT
jgi:hypothetical protein